MGTQNHRLVTVSSFTRGRLKAWRWFFQRWKLISVCKDVCSFLDVFYGLELWRWNSDRCLCMYYWHWLVENEHWPTKFIVIHILLNTHLLCIPTTIPIYFLYLLVLNVSGSQLQRCFAAKALWRCCNSSWGSHNLGVSYSIWHKQSSHFLNGILGILDLRDHPQLEREICWYMTSRY